MKPSSDTSGAGLGAWQTAAEDSRSFHAEVPLTLVPAYRLRYFDVASPVLFLARHRSYWL